MDYKQLFPVYLNNPGLVYLDSAASALKPEAVINAIDDYYRHYSTNIERGVYSLSFNATIKCEESRAKVAKFINALPEEVVFTRGCTDSLNYVALSLRNSLKPGDEIITSLVEHHSSFLPWLKVSEETGAIIRFVPLTEEGKITVSNFKKVLSDKTKIVALTHVSNVLGYVTPIKEIIKLAHEKGAIVSVDGAQAIPHFKVDVKDLDCDFYSFSFHKLCGPTGLGVLYGKKELLEKIDPAEFGGHMIDEVTKTSVTYKEPPYKFEAGTMPIAEMFAAGATVDFISSIGIEKIEERTQYLAEMAREGLRSIPEIEMYNDHGKTAVVTFNIKGVHSHDSIQYYSEHGICMRAGHHCAENLHDFLHISASLRASFYFYNDEADVKAFLDVTKEAISFFKEVGYLG